MDRYDECATLLSESASTLYEAATSGAFSDSGRKIVIRDIGYIVGPRAGTLQIDAGLDASRLYRLLSAADNSLARQLIEWDYPSSPSVYMHGKYIRIEAGWPDRLAEMNISLSSLGHMGPYEIGRDRWIAGRNDLGQTVTLGLNDKVNSYLVSGMTGAGKTVAIQSMSYQLSRGGTRLIFIDGKRGDGLRNFDHLDGTVGPLATTVEDARNALAWVVEEMNRRYDLRSKDAILPYRIVVVIDEVQVFMEDPAIVEMVKRISAQGRSALISLILATQHPTVATFGDPATKRNIGGRLALLVADDVASNVAIGQRTPRADWLLGHGDAFGVVPGAIQRMQVVFVEERELRRAMTYRPMLPEWPAANIESALPSQSGQSWPTGDEIGEALISAAKNEGRKKLQDRIAIGDNNRASALIKLSKEALVRMADSGASICFDDEGVGDE